MFYSEKYKLLVDREKIIVSKRKESEFERVLIEKEESEINFPIKLSFQTSENIFFGDKKSFLFFWITRSM